MIKCKQETCDNKTINFEFCCWSCPHSTGCEVKCVQEPSKCGFSETASNDEALTVFQTKSAALIKNIADLMLKKAEIEASEKAMREKLEAAMLEHRIEKLDHELLKITYVKATTRTSVDSKKLQAAYPHIYAECSKPSPVKGHVKIELKKG